MKYSLVDQLGNIIRTIQWYEPSPPPTPLDDTVRWVVVQETPAPVVDDSHEATQGPAVLDENGSWVRSWVVMGLTQEEIAARKQAQVPQQVTMRQARLVLLQAGLYASVNSTIANLTGDIGDAARIEWEYSQTVQRRYPLIETLSSVLNMSDEQLDALFIQAAQL